MALNTQYRLRKERDIRAVLKDGRSQRGGFLFIKYQANKMNFSRFAVIIPLKVARTVVTRNRLRRTISEALRNMLASIRPGNDVVIRLSAIPPRGGLQEELPTLLKKANLVP